MNDIYLPHFYSAESVTDGHPDKLCDQIADAVLDSCLALDRNARVACEVAATKGHIFLMGEITASARPNEAEIAREVLRHVGYNPKDYEIHTVIHPQSPDIEAAVNDPLDTGADPDAIGAGDQCVVVGYATDETPEMLPLPVVLAHRLTSRLTWARINDEQKRFGPDGKAMAIVEYEDERPVRVARIVVSFQHAPGVEPAELAEPGCRHRPDRPQAGRGWIRPVCAHRRRGVFRQRPDQARPQRGVHGAVRGQKHRGKRHRAAVPGHADLCHRHGQAAGRGGGYLRHRPALRG